MKKEIEQIRVDVPRTWSGFKAYTVKEGQYKLERVLVSWVAHNLHVGYCQGLNFICAMILSVCKGNEDECISIFISLMERTSFGEYFDRENKFETLRNDTKILEERLLLRDPILCKHLKNIEFELLNVSNWFITCFFLRLEPSGAMLILDKVIRGGKKAREILVNSAVESLIDERDEILRCLDFEEMFCLLKRSRLSGDENRKKSRHSID